MNMISNKYAKKLKKPKWSFSLMLSKNLPLSHYYSSWFCFFETIISFHIFHNLKFLYLNFTVYNFVQGTLLQLSQHNLQVHPYYYRYASTVIWSFHVFLRHITSTICHSYHFYVFETPSYAMYIYNYKNKYAFDLICATWIFCLPILFINYFFRASREKSCLLSKYGWYL